MDYSKVKGAGEKVSPPKVQEFTKHKPVLPSEQKLKYVKK